MKYLVLSFDDNTVHDRKVVALLNKYRLKGTFYINSGNLNKDGFVTKEEIEELYKGHEVASHTVNHPRLKELKKNDVRYQIEQDIDNIEAYSKQKVQGFAYPYGDFNKKIKSVVEELGLKYARTVKGTKEFTSPKDFLEWNPTMHFSGLAYVTEDRERRNRGVGFMFDHVEKFLDDPNDGILHLWMHSWEFKDDRFKWDQLERLCKIISQEEDVLSVTAKEYYKKKNWHLK